VKRRYVVKPDFYTPLSSSGKDWAVYDTTDERYGTADEWPLAVFAVRADAMAFRRMKEGK
jgi:hypothetical protein